jgi:heme A synthase
MLQPRSRLEKLLVNYYGLLQISHITGLVISGVWWFTTGNLGVLALPPRGGWDDQTIHFLLATGMFDFVVAIGAIVFVYQYRSEEKTSDLLGGASLTGSLYSAVIYAYGTLRSGAWGSHPLTYGLIAIVFTPMVILAIVFFFGRVVGDPKS